MNDNQNHENANKGPEEPEEKVTPPERTPARTRQEVERIWRIDIMLVGLTLIAIGIVLLVSTLNPDFDLSELVFTYWPLLLVAAGLIKIIQAFMGVTSRGSGLGWLVFAVIIIFIALGVHWDLIDSDDWGFRFGGFGFGVLIDSSTQNVDFAEGQRLELDMADTNVKIYGYGGDRIKLSKKVYARRWGRRNREEQEGVFDVDITRLEDVVRIISRPSDRLDRATRYYIELELQIPDGTVLNVIGTNTDVVVRDLEGEIEITTVEGDVDVHGVDGTVVVKAEAGDFDGDDLRGKLEVRGNRFDLDLDEIYGVILVDLDRGNISLDNDHPVEGDISIETRRGRIGLEIHRDSEIDFTADAGSGRVYFDFGGIDVVERRDFRRRVNGGTFKVFLKTGGGSVKLEES